MGGPSVHAVPGFPLSVRLRAGRRAVGRSPRVFAWAVVAALRECSRYVGRGPLSRIDARRLSRRGGGWLRSVAVRRSRAARAYTFCIIPSVVRRGFDNRRSGDCRRGSSPPSTLIVYHSSGKKSIPFFDFFKKIFPRAAATFGIAAAARPGIPAAARSDFL